MRIRKAACVMFLAGVALGVLGQALPPAQAGVLSRLRASIRSLWTQKSEKQSAAHKARTRAHVLNARSEALHDRLERTQQLLQHATANYSNYRRQLRRTEARIVAARHRVQIVTANYKRHRALFGDRLAAMQRNGKLDYLQMFLGSRTLSDLTRRIYLFNTLTSRDAALQTALREDRLELQRTHNMLMSQWQQRNRLQRIANRERERIARGQATQQSVWKQINNSRYALLAYAAAEERSSRELEGMIGDLSARRAAIIQSYEAEMARQRAARRFESRRSQRRYRGARYAGRGGRIRYSNAAGGYLRPMSAAEVLYEGDEHSHDTDNAGSTNGWGAPVSGRINSRYGMRFHPILRRRKMHTGDDLAARYGAPIKAAHNGRVLWSGWKKAYGNTIIIDNGRGVTTLYGHASKLSVKPGQPIKRGEYIGNVGSTGWSTGPHLHFEVRKNGKPIDPTPYLRGKRQRR
ncbi:MAG TPA: peptidoglycan DD-metalloendopeptidase family protein [Abditibacteriaceae bacterium]|nr:peptidoglycan DD-metalloendopeptidase family protein [Abditibacteriaceae bacterium]